MQLQYINEKKYAPYKLLPILIINNNIVPTAEQLSFFQKEQHGIICNKYIKIHQNTINQCSDILKSKGWTNEDLMQLYFITITEDLDPLKIIDYFFLSFIRNQKSYPFRKEAYSHFLWFTDHSDLKIIELLINLSKESYEQKKEKKLLFKIKNDYPSIPEEGIVYTHGFYFLTNDMLCSNKIQEYSYLINASDHLQSIL